MHDHIDMGNDMFEIRAVSFKMDKGLQALLLHGAHQFIPQRAATKNKHPCSRMFFKDGGQCLKKHRMSFAWNELRNHCQNRAIAGKSKFFQKTFVVGFCGVESDGVNRTGNADHFMIGHTHL